MSFYKVVRVSREGSLVSAGLSNSSPNRLTYRPGKWTSAKAENRRLGYGICIFDTLSGAERYVQQTGLDSTYQVWLVEIRGLRKVPPPALFWADRLEVTKLLRGGSPGEFPWPFGTVMAANIKLTKLIKEYIEYAAHRED